jgi:hypothetical protein
MYNKLKYSFKMKTITTIPKSKILFLIAVSVLIVSGYRTQAVSINALTSGNWENSSSWVEGRVPMCGDTINIGPGIIIQITTLQDFSACNSTMYLDIAGTLHFQTGKKLKLPCGSMVNLQANAFISAGGGGGNSNFIEICSQVVWNAAMGTLEGPLVLEVTPLPVELIHFSATALEKTIELSWITAAEINNAYFVIEKSKDGILYTSLGSVRGMGTTSNLNSYSFIDQYPSTGMQYYRLKQIDFDGQINLAKTVAIRWQTKSDFNLYPNPSNGELFLKIPPMESKEKGMLYINRSDGSLIVSAEIIFDEISSEMALVNYTGKLKPGAYIVRINLADSSFSKHIIMN